MNSIKKCNLKLKTIEKGNFKIKVLEPPTYENAIDALIIIIRFDDSLVCLI